MRRNLALVWLVLGLTLPFHHAPASAAPSEKIPESRKRLVGTSELVQAGRSGTVISDCRVDGKNLDQAILELTREWKGLKDSERAGRMLLGLANCVIYPAGQTWIQQKAAAGTDRFLIEVPFEVSIKDSRIKERPFDDVESVDDKDLGQLFAVFDWSSVIFLKEVDFSGSVFEVRADFVQTHFEETLNLRETVFKKDVNFDDAKFKGRNDWRATVFSSLANFRFAEFPTKHATTFSDTQFLGKAVFSEATLHAVMRFRNVKFSGEVLFNDVTFDRALIFFSTKFPDTVDLRGVKDSGLSKYDDHGIWFVSSTFKEMVWFDGLNVRRLSLAVPPTLGNDGKPVRVRRVPSGEGVIPSIFEKEVSFRAVRCAVCDLTRGQFRARVDMSRAEVTDVLDLSRSTFSSTLVVSGLHVAAPKKSASADDGCRLASADARGGFAVDGASFDKGLRGRSANLAGALHSADSDTWTTMAEAFKSSGEDDGELRARFCAERVQRAGRSGLETAGDLASYYFWGYQTMPERVLLWLALWWLLFVPVYYTQTAPLSEPRRRLAYSLRFSAERCLKFDVTGSAARTTIFKIVTITQSMGAKVIALLFLKAMASRFPMVEGVLSKVLPL
jgi:Pentapeptide repeats (9 copies)